MIDLTRSDWQFINTFAPWLSAIGTLSAVALALHLARGKTRVKLTVSVDLKIILEPTISGYKPSGDDFVVIEVVNTGETEATITNIGWMGRKDWKRAAAIQNLDDGIYAGTKLPARLKFGEEASFRIRVRPHWLSQVAEGMMGRFSWWSKRRLRCVICPSSRILNLLAQEANKQRNQKANPG